MRRQTGERISSPIDETVKSIARLKCRSKVLPSSPFRLGAVRAEGRITMLNPHPLLSSRAVVPIRAPRSGSYSVVCTGGASAKPQRAPAPREAARGLGGNAGRSGHTYGQTLLPCPHDIRKYTSRAAGQARNNRPLLFASRRWAAGQTLQSAPSGGPPRPAAKRTVSPATPQARRRISGN